MGSLVQKKGKGVLLKMLKYKTFSLVPWSPSLCLSLSPTVAVFFYVLFDIVLAWAWGCSESDRRLSQGLETLALKLGTCSPVAAGVPLPQARKIDDTLSQVSPFPWDCHFNP